MKKKKKHDGDGMRVRRITVMMIHRSGHLLQVDPSLPPPGFHLPKVLGRKDVVVTDQGTTDVQGCQLPLPLDI